MTCLTHETIDWGTTAYEDACLRQQTHLDKRIEGEVPNTLIFTEHHPVYTLGRRKDAAENLIWDASTRKTKGIDCVHTNRGGDVTYHGPGQIVGYPIISLQHKKDLHAYLRTVEQVILDSLKTFGLNAERRAEKTGIWIGTKKIAAIGIAVKHWVTYHGFALNVNNDLTPFTGIIPCGIPQEEGTVTSLSMELGQHIDIQKVKETLSKSFWSYFLV